MTMTMSIKTINKRIACIDMALENLQDKMRQHVFNRMIMILIKDEELTKPIEDDKMTEFYKKSIENSRIEKIIYLTLKRGNKELFGRLFEKYNENSVELLELSNELVSLGDISEGLHIELSNDVLKHINHFKALCQIGSEGISIIN